MRLRTVPASALPRTLALPLSALLAVACARDPTPPTPLTHEAYVWQRRWGADLAAAASAAPAELAAYRVLVEERAGEGRNPVRVHVDIAALAASRRSVVVVLRVDGTRPLAGISLRPLLALTRGWAAGGVAVRGLEVDHDCPSAALDAYAAWLEGERAALGGLALSITALPSWSGAAGLPRLLAAVDHVVLQLHAIRAPALFDPAQARRDLERWARGARRAFRVALPTYRVRLRSGAVLAAEPAVVARFLAGLRERPVPRLTGVLWFRLGHRADHDAWSVPTLAAVLRGESLAPRLATRLRGAGNGPFDILLENTGAVDAALPRTLQLSGALELLEGVRGYAALGSALVARHAPTLQPGESAVVGFARGQEITVALP